MARGPEPSKGRPVCTVLGGANGSGKSSVYETLRPPGMFVNADAAAKRIDPDHPEAASFAAGRQVLRQLNALIAARSTFVYETTLSGRQPLDVMRRAKSAGYEVGLIFVVLASVDLNVERVAQRVARGGHDIPEPVIRRRYEKSLSRLGQAMAIADATVVLDNTELEPSVLLRMRAGVVEYNGFRKDRPDHARIVQLLGSRGLT